MRKKQISQAASLMGKSSYRARLERFGIDRIRAIARENGKLGGRPKGKAKAKNSLKRTSIEIVLDNQSA